MSSGREQPADAVDVANTKKTIVEKTAPDFRYQVARTPTVDRRLNTNLLERAIRRHVAMHVASPGAGEVPAEQPVHTPDVPEVVDEDDDGVAGINPDTLLEALLVSDQAFLETVVPTMLSQAISLTLFYRAIVRPVAERLGDLWCDDEIDFVKVEIISMRLRLMCNQLVTQRLAGRSPLPDYVDRHVLLAHTTGDRHTLGFTLAEAFFRDAGWYVGGGADIEPGPEYYEALNAGAFTLVALAFSRDDGCDVADLVKRSRDASSNPNILICLGGVAVSASPERFRQSGADIIAIDAPDAVRQAELALAGRLGRNDDERRDEDVFR